MFKWATLPRNGCIHQRETCNIKQEIQSIQRDVTTERLIAESTGFRAEAGSDVEADCSRLFSIVRLDQTDISVSPFGASVT